MGESTGIGAAGVRTNTQKPSQLSLFGKVLLPLLSFQIFATIPLDFLVWATSCHILPRHATTGPLLAGWVSIKWRGLTTHLHHKQGDLYKMEGSNSHLHHITLLLCGREQKNWSSRGQNQYSEAISALTPRQSSTSSTILSDLCYHPSWLLGLGNLLPHLATTCHDWALSAYYRSLCLVCRCSFSIEWSSGGPTLRRTAGNFDFTHYCIASSDLNSDRAE